MFWPLFQFFLKKIIYHKHWRINCVIFIWIWCVFTCTEDVCNIFDLLLAAIQIVLFKYYFWIHLYFLHSISSLEHTKDIVSTFIKDLQKILALPASYISENYFKIKINLNFYFRTSLWCLRRFYGGLKDLHKTFEAPQRSPKVKI